MSEPENDEALRRRFETLRRTEGGSAPAFDATWAAARRRADAQKRRAAVAVGLGTLAAAAIALMVVLGPRTILVDTEDAQPESATASATRDEQASGAALDDEPAATESLMTRSVSVADTPVAAAPLSSPTEFLLAAPMPVAVDLERGADPFRYGLAQLLAETTSGDEP